MSITPTVGRIVLFHRQGETLPGIITRVHDERLIDVTVFGDVPSFERNVILNQEGDEDGPLEIGQASWMPYQHARAAKADLPLDEIKAQVDDLSAHVAKLAGHVGELLGAPKSDGLPERIEQIGAAHNALAKIVQGISDKVSSPAAE